MRDAVRSGWAKRTFDGKGKLRSSTIARTSQTARASLRASSSPSQLCCQRLKPQETSRIAGKTSIGDDHVCWVVLLVSSTAQVTLSLDPHTLPALPTSTAKTDRTRPRSSHRFSRLTFCSWRGISPFQLRLGFQSPRHSCRRASLHNIRQHKLRAQARIDASSDLVHHHRHSTPLDTHCFSRPSATLPPIQLPSLCNSQSCRRTGLRRSPAYAWAVRIPKPPPRCPFYPLLLAARPPHRSASALVEFIAMPAYFACANAVQR